MAVVEMSQRDLYYGRLCAPFLHVEKSRLEVFAATIEAGKQ